MILVYCGDAVSQEGLAGNVSTVSRLLLFPGTATSQKQ